MNTLYLDIIEDDLLSYKNLLLIYFVEIDISFVKAKTIIIYFHLKEFVITDLKYAESVYMPVEDLKDLLESKK